MALQLGAGTAMVMVQLCVSGPAGWYVAVQAEMLVAKADETGEQSELQIAL